MPHPFAPVGQAIIATATTPRTIPAICSAVGRSPKTTIAMTAISHQLHDALTAQSPAPARFRRISRTIIKLPRQNSASAPTSTGNLPVRRIGLAAPHWPPRTPPSRPQARPPAPAHRRPRACCMPRRKEHRYDAYRSDLIGMPRPQPLAHPVGDLDELPAVADIQRPFLRQGLSITSVIRPGRGDITTILVDR